jgi:hypothetical protein
MGTTRGDHVRPFLNALRDAFGVGKDKYAAHERARPVLQDMAASSAAFSAVLDQHLHAPDALNLMHYPVVSLDIETNAHFGLVANCWIPLPDHNTDISTKAIHHHGQMLLTTVTAFGPGYEHWTFTTPQVIDAAREVYAMRLIERAPHPTGHAAFVDASIGHVPFYPPSLTITLALWSNRDPTTWRDVVKRVPALHKNSTTLRRIAASAGLVRMLDLKVARYFDFFPSAEGFQGMKDRLEFGRGPNEDYLQSLFHVIQQTHNDGLGPGVRQRLEAAPAANRALVVRLLDDLERGRAIDGRLSPGHYGVPYANFRGEDIERALGVCASRTGLTPA